MNSIKNTQTEKNLLLSFCGESQARNRYTFFAKKAMKDGFMQISATFEEIANQEKVHAKAFFNFLEGGDVEITSKFPAGIIGTTLENLKAAAEGEHHEHTRIYPEFAKIAREEKFNKVASIFDAISIAEKQHEKRFIEFASNIENNKVFKKESSSSLWRCRNCGYVDQNNQAPNTCPACAHPQKYFELLT